MTRRRRRLAGRALGAIGVATLLAWAPWALRGGGARADAPTPRFVVDGDATVTDTVTGLVWERHPASAPEALSHADAEARCKSLALAGARWRLPSAKELFSLLDHTLPADDKPLLDRTAFPELYTGWFWSSTGAPQTNIGAWTVDFLYGSLQPHAAAETGRVRCLRAK
jgi:hypothetical protein